MKGRAIQYSHEELLFIETGRFFPRRVVHAAFCEYFGRTDVTLTHIASLSNRKGWTTGRTGCFPKGHRPANKGKKMPFNPKRAETQFKEGHGGTNNRPMWSERVDKNGYIEMKVPVPNPYTTAKSRFMHKHRYLWEQKNGPLPRGMVLKCWDGNRTNCEPENWFAIPQSLLPRLNSRFGRDFDTAPLELKPTILATAKLAQAAQEAARARS